MRARIAGEGTGLTTMLASLVGAAVALPLTVASRQSCHYNFSCYKQYKPSMGFWDVFDRAQTLRALEAAGVCVVDSLSSAVPFRRDGTHREKMAWFAGTASKRIPVVQPSGRPLRLPVAASTLEISWLSGKIRLTPHQAVTDQQGQDGQTGDMLTQRAQSVAAYQHDSVWSWASENACCTNLIPDTLHSLRLMRQVNAAFQRALSNARRMASSSEELGRDWYAAFERRWRACPDATPDANSHAAAGHLGPLSIALARVCTLQPLLSVPREESCPETVPLHAPTPPTR